MGDKEVVIIVVAVAASAIGLYELYQWYITSGLNQPVSGTPAAAAKNAAVTTTENVATAAAQPGATGGNAPATGAVAGGSWNQLSIELNAYDPDVASMINQTSYYAMTAAGVPVTQVNVYMNALEDYYKSYGVRPANATVAANYLSGLGVPSATASLFASYLSYGG
jgi:hypothetical protein